LHEEIGEVPLLVGYIDVNSGAGAPFRNAAALLQRGEPIQRVFKSLLPTYDVFDEARYFEPAENAAPLDVRGVRVGVTICEDIWTERFLPRRLYGFEPVHSLVAQGAELIVNLSASPFILGKVQRRHLMLGALAAQHQVPICYCNATGGNDELIFDGNSFAHGADGSLLAHLPAFEDALAVIDTALPGTPADRAVFQTSRKSSSPRSWSAPAITFTSAALNPPCWASAAESIAPSPP
jgi:predicted amidohydrolase